MRHLRGLDKVYTRSSEQKQAKFPLRWRTFHIGMFMFRAGLLRLEHDVHMGNSLKEPEVAGGVFCVDDGLDSCIDKVEYMHHSLSVWTQRPMWPGYDMPVIVQYESGSYGVRETSFY